MDISKALWPGLITPAISAASSLGLGAGEDCRVAAAIFGDGEYKGGANKFMRAPFDSPGDDSFNGRYAGTQGFRHLTTTNVAFCGPNLEFLAAACVGEEYLAIADLGVRGQPLRRPALP